MLIHRYIYFPLFLIIIALLFVRMAEDPTDEDYETPMRDTVPIGNGIYYWKTTYNPTAYEKKFYQDHKIDRMYIRMFDVDIKEDYYHDTITTQPIATTIFKQEPPRNMEIVPTVFFTLRAIEICANQPKAYCQRLLKRIEDMALRHNFNNNIKEIQFDCDWTASTQEAYFRFCKEAARQLKAKGWILSSTIRLHQLSQPAPPVARGALMLYNTGNFKDVKTENSILDWKAATPYLKNASYPIPLDFAYPTFSWNLLFRNDEFQYIIHDLGNILTMPNDWYIRRGCMFAKRNMKIGDNQIEEGDRVRTEHSEFAQIKAVKKLAEKQLMGSRCNIILYHSDSTNLAKYAHDEIDYIYSR